MRSIAGLALLTGCSENGFHSLGKDADVPVGNPDAGGTQTVALPGTTPETTSVGTSTSSTSSTSTTSSTSSTSTTSTSSTSSTTGTTSTPPDPADPPVADAGPDETYQPLDTVLLDGTGSYDPGGYEPLDYAWTLLTLPANSTAVLDDPTLPEPSFLADLAGDYVLELEVTSTIGLVDTDTVVITTTPADGFYVELSWPGNGDLDLHLLNSSATGIFDCPGDCNFDEPNPDWGVAGLPDDDPSLDEDTIPSLIGSGPEITTIDAPAADTYTILVHYYGENGLTSCGLFSCPDTDATVNVYLGGVLAATYTETLFDDDDVWEVATIDWPSGLVTPIGVVSASTRTSCF